ncbi:MAG: peptidase M6, partial [Candidatus Aminicenantaceae bacterium]
HFYVIDTRKDEQGILSYTLAVRSLDGSGPQERGIAMESQANHRVRQPHTPVTFTLTNTGTAVDTDPALHAVDARAYLNSDVYRLSVSVEGEGWTAQLLNGLAAVESGESQAIKVYVSQTDGSAPSANVILRATSESDPSKTAAATVEVSR